MREKDYHIEGCELPSNLHCQKSFHRLLEIRLSQAFRSYGTMSRSDVSKIVSVKSIYIYYLV